jgi:hypothetical protein
MGDEITYQAARITPPIGKIQRKAMVSHVGIVGNFMFMKWVVIVGDVRNRFMRRCWSWYGRRNERIDDFKHLEVTKDRRILLDTTPLHTTPTPWQGTIRRISHLGYPGPIADSASCPAKQKIPF